MSMVEGELLGRHRMCGELARAVVYPQDTFVTGALGRTVDFVIIETLPPQVRGAARLRKHHVDAVSHAAGSLRATENISRSAAESPILSRVLEGDRRSFALPCLSRLPKARPFRSSQNRTLIVFSVAPLLRGLGHLL